MVAHVTYVSNYYLSTAVVPPARAIHKWLIPVIVVVILLVLAGVILAIIVIW